MDTSFLKLMKGSRLNNYMGLKMEEGYEFKCGQNYLYLKIPFLSILSEAGPAHEVKRNQHVFLGSAATVTVKGRNFIEIEANPALSEFGQAQGLYRVHPDSGTQQLGIWFTARKDTNLAELEYLLRVYMPI